MNGNELLKRDFLGDLTPREGRCRKAALLAVKETVKSPLPLAALAVGLLSATFLPLSVPLALVAFAYATAFFGRFHRQRRQIDAQPADPSTRISLPDLIWYSDPAAQAAIRRLREARQRLRDVIRNSPQGPEPDLIARLRGAREAERMIVVGAARVEHIGAFLTGISRPELEAELELARNRCTSSDNRAARTTSELAVAQREMRLADARLLEVKRDQLIATLDYLLGTLEMLPLKLTRLQLLRVEVTAADPSGAAAHATQLLDELEAIDEVFHSGAEAPEEPSPATRAAPSRSDLREVRVAPAPFGGILVPAC
jgi:hypothetical protein